MIKATKKNIVLLSTMLMGPISLSLLIISVYIIQPKVEAKLTSNVISILQKNNISAEVSFSGRDGVLKGVVDSQKIADDAKKLSLSVFGTRIIHNRLNVINSSLEETSVSSSTPITENIVLATAEKNEFKESIKPTFKAVETISNNKLSDIDKIMVNMQKQSLLKPKYAPVEVVEKKQRETANNIQIISAKAPEKISESIEIIKADNSKEHIKPILVIATSNDVKHSEKIKKERSLQSKESSVVLDIIEDFNTFLEAPSSAGKKENNTIVAKTLDAINLPKIHFTGKSSTLSNESYSILDQVSQSIKTYYHAPLDIIVYANDSDIAYQQGVAIRNYLVKKGIERSKIGVSGHTITVVNKGKITPISIKIRK